MSNKINNLNLFHTFYQTCKKDQCIDLSKSKAQFLLPESHPSAEKIYDAIEDFKNRKPTKITPFEDAQDLFNINDDPNWLLRPPSEGTKSIIQDKHGPASSKTLRVVMNHRLKEAVQNHKIDIIIPDEYLVEGSSKKNQKENFRDFFVVSEKLDIHSYYDTLTELRSLEQKKQKKAAKSVCSLIYHSGFMDAHWANIVLTKDKNLAIVDTEGHSLLHDITEKYSPVSLSTARILGLKEFIKRSKEASLPDLFINTAKRYLFMARVMKIVKVTTIVFSVICPLLPLSVLISSVVSAKFQNAQLQDHTPKQPSYFQPQLVTV